MKKQLKKILSTVLAVLMLVSVMGIQSLAAPSLLPSVTDVEITMASDISLKDVKRHFDSYKEMYDLMIGDDSDISYEDFLRDNGTLMCYNVLYDCEKIKVTLSNGKVFEVGEDSLGLIEYNSLVSIYINAVVTYDEYKKAVKKNADTVGVVVTATVSLITDTYGRFDSTSDFETKVGVVDCYVKSIKPVSKLPKTVYYASDYLKLDGKKFEIVYADGTKKTAAVVMSDDEEYGGVKFTLDGKELYYFYNESDIEFSFMDAVYNSPVKFKEGDIFESILITDCVFDDNSNLTSISYDITWDSGKTKSYTNEVNFNSEDYYQIIECIDGYYVYLSYDIPWDADYEDNFTYITLDIGETQGYVQIMDTTNDSFLSRLIDMIVNFLISIFGVM